jgi:hypothetical protein
MVKKIIFAVLITIVLTISSYSQTSKDKSTVIVTGGGACEENSAYFDVITNEVVESKERIFIIFRGGKGETETVNARRLNYVKGFLQNSKGWKVFDTIYARGEKTNGDGKIEFYLGGKLFLIVMSPKNKTPCLNCCENLSAEPQNLIKKKRNTKRKS